MRQDMMVIELTEKEQRLFLPHNSNEDSTHRLPDLPAVMSNAQYDGQVRKVKIVEGGYCTDTRYLEKLHQKPIQHATLISALNTVGYEVHIFTYILGLFGSTYHSNMDIMRALGIEDKAANRLSRQIHELTVKCANNLNIFMEDSRSHHGRKRARADPPIGL